MRDRTEDSGQRGAVPAEHICAGCNVHVPNPQAPDAHVCVPDGRGGFAKMTAPEAAAAAKVRDEHAPKGPAPEPVAKPKALAHIPDTAHVVD